MNKEDMLVVLLCTTLLTMALTAVAMPVAYAIDRFPSIAGPIFRTQPAPNPAPSPSEVYIAVTETELIPQPTLCHSNDQTSVDEIDENILLCNPTSSPQQQLHSTLSINGESLPQKIQPEDSNETSESTDTYAQYCDQDGEDVEDDYIPFFCCIPIILLIMLILLGTLNLQYCCPIMKKNSMHSICSQTSNFQQD